MNSHIRKSPVLLIINYEYEALYFLACENSFVNLKQWIHLLLGDI